MIAKLTYNAGGTGRLEVACDDCQLIDISDAVRRDSVKLLTAPYSRPGLQFQVTTRLLEIHGAEAIAAAVWCGAPAHGQHDTETCALPPNHEPPDRHVSVLGHTWINGADR